MEGERGNVANETAFDSTFEMETEPFASSFPLIPPVQHLLLYAGASEVKTKTAESNRRANYKQPNSANFKLFPVEFFYHEI